MKRAKGGVSRGTLWIFLALVAGFAAIFELLATRYNAGTFNLMWSVGLAAMLAVWITGRDPRSLGWGWGRWRYQALAYCLPVAYLGIAYGIVWALGLGGFFDHDWVERLRHDLGFTGWSDGAVIAYRVLTAGTFGLAGSLSTALGEEIGWRGFLVPELAKSLSFTGVALVSSAIWAVWHLPLILWGNYHNAASDFPLRYQLLCFATIVLSAGIMLAYLRLKSGSLWTAAIFHASHNLWLQSILNPLTRMKPGTVRYIDELGIVPPLVAAAFAIYFLARGRREFPAPDRGQAAASLPGETLPAG